MKHKILVIGFDGTDYWKIFYVEVHDKKEVYYAFCSKKVKLSFSRHGSGKQHVKINGEKVDCKLKSCHKKIPLEELEEIESLGTFVPAIEKKVSEEDFKKYFSAKHSYLLLTDLREQGTLNIQLSIVKPKNKEEILKREFLNGEKIHIYTSSDPWVVLSIVNAK